MLYIRSFETMSLCHDCSHIGEFSVILDVKFVYLILMNIPFIMVRTNVSHPYTALCRGRGEIESTIEAPHRRVVFLNSERSSYEDVENSQLRRRRIIRVTVISYADGDEYLYQRPIRPVRLLWLHLHREMIGWSPNLLAVLSSPIGCLQPCDRPVAYRLDSAVVFSCQNLDASVALASDILSHYLGKMSEE